MALSSPRFAANKHLNAVSRNASVLKKGKGGRSVHIVQQALIDLGFPISASDGKFGPVTDGALKKFQRRHRLKEDGIIGPKTMRKLDNALSKYQHRVGLHFRSINLTAVPFEKIFKSTQKVYDQYGIKIEMLTGKSLLLTPAEMKKYFVVKTSCNWEINSGEVNDLHSKGGSVSSSEILVYYVNKFSDATLLGCGGHAKNRPAVTVASNASQWDTAHEIGHVLLTSAFTPVHSTDTKNLMYAFSQTISQTPILTNRQLTQIRSHICCKAI